jgi:hypothetical protein
VVIAPAGIFLRQQYAAASYLFNPSKAANYRAKTAR